MKQGSGFAKNLSIKIILATSALLMAVVFVLVSLETVTTIKNCKNKLNVQVHMTVQHIGAELKIIEQLSDLAVKHASWIPTDKTEQFLKEFAESNPYVKDAGIYFNPEKTRSTGLIIPIVTKDSETGKLCYMLAQDERALKEILQDFNYYISQYDIIDIERHQSSWLGPYRDINGVCEFSYIAATDSEYPETDIMEVSITLNWLSDFLADVKPYDNTEAFVMDGNSNLICSTSQNTDLSVSSGLGSKVTLEDQDLEKYKNTKTFDVDFKEKCIIGKEVMDNGWIMIVKCPLREVFADVLKSLRNMVFLMTISLLLLFLFCSRIIFKKSRPLVEFASATGSIARGNFDTELPVIKEKDEISQLRDAFANMQTSLKDYIRNLSEVTATKQRMESELNIATGIQLQALRKVFPSNEKYDLYAAMHAAKEVGGDLYDFVQKDNKLYVCIGDVSGKGVPAALLMMITTMMFRHVCTTSDRPLNEMVSIINNCIADGNDSGFFVTLFIACIDLNTGEMQFCNGGHNDIIIVSPEGKADFNKAKANIACGVFEDFHFVDESIKLEKGSRVILYTDGVNEAMNTSNEEFGNDRLIEWAGTTPGFSDEKSLVENLISEVKSFTSGAEQSDDITILSLKIN